jgi:hypothetical protein
LRVGVLAQAPGGPLTSSAWIRLLLPLQRLQQQGCCTLVELESSTRSQAFDLSSAGLDRLIVQRAACPSRALANDLVQSCRQQGVPLILDLDDALFALPAEHPEQLRYAPAIPALDDLLTLADLRVFSTTPLALQCRERMECIGQAPGVDAVLANGLDPGLWAGAERFPRSEPDGPLKLLYMGSRTHDADLALILPELDALAARDPSVFHLTLVGGLSQPLQRPWVDVVEVPLEARRYPRFVRWLRRLPRHDLGLAPLVLNAFNAAKSDLKLLDYAAMGLPTLCSPGPAYQHLLAAGLAFAAEPGQWAELLLWAHYHRRRLRRQAKAINHYLWDRCSGESLASKWLTLLQMPDGPLGY